MSELGWTQIAERFEHHPYGMHPESQKKSVMLPVSSPKRGSPVAVCSQEPHAIKYPGAAQQN